MQIRSEVFLRKVANRQTNRQTYKEANNDDYTSSLAEVTTEIITSLNSVIDTAYKKNCLVRSFCHSRNVVRIPGYSCDAVVINTR